MSPLFQDWLVALMLHFLLTSLSSSHISIFFYLTFTMWLLDVAGDFRVFLPSLFLSDPHIVVISFSWFSRWISIDFFFWKFRWQDSLLPFPQTALIDVLRSGGVVRCGHLYNGSIRWVDRWFVIDSYRFFHTWSWGRELAKYERTVKGLLGRPSRETLRRSS